MPSFHHGDVKIAYLDEGEASRSCWCTALASSKNVNWVYPTWVSETGQGRPPRRRARRSRPWRVHELYDPTQYEIAIMASDVTALMDHLEIARADIMGYSLARG